MRIGIVGSAGRRGDAQHVSQATFQWMLDDIEGVLEQEGLDWSEVELLSGGAAFADHVAVRKALEHQVALTLFLPCAWDHERQAYADTGVRDWRSNPGGTSNYYHRTFSRKCGGDADATLKELDAALQLPRTTLEFDDGFFARNNGIAQQSELLIAYTFGQGETPSSGGTLRTWNACKAKRIKRTIPQ